MTAYFLIITIFMGGQEIQLAPYIVRGLPECVAAGKQYVQDAPGHQKFRCEPTRLYLANHG